MMKFDEQLYVNFFLLAKFKFDFSIALICPSSDSTKPDPDCFRMAREHIWELIEQRFFSFRHRIKEISVFHF
jgi:hypothetical protein